MPGSVRTTPPPYSATMRKRFSACACPPERCPSPLSGESAVRDTAASRGGSVMRERERRRERSFYEQIIDSQRAERQRSYTGQVVVRGRGNPWILDRQGLVRHYLKPSRYTGEPVDTA